MANNNIPLHISENQVSVPLRVNGRSLLRSIEPDNGSPYYVGARAYVTQTENGATITVIDKDGTTTATVTNGAKGDTGATGATGNGIDSAVLNNDYTLTLNFTDGTSYTTTSIRGATGAKGATGTRGRSILQTPHAPTLASGRYRISRATVQSDTGVMPIKSDTICYGTYLYPVAEVDNTYAYMDSRTNIRGAAGADGTDGEDGFSPSATVSKVGGTATITITDKDGTTTASISDGAGGASAFVAEYGVTTYADVKAVYDDDAILICTVDGSDNKMVLQLVYFDSTNEIFFFAFPTSDGWYWTQLSNADGWGDGMFYFASTDVATQLADGLMSALDKQKLDGLSKRNIWYGTCSTSASQSPKAITTASGDFSLTAGNMLCVLFSHTNSLSSVSLQVDGGTSKSAYSMDGTSDISNRWGSNEVVMFVYDGTKFVMLEQGMASTTQYGITKLNNTTTSTSTSEAATANAVKSAYDHGGVQSVNGSTGAVTLTETDPVFSASAAAGISSSDISNWNGKSDFSGNYDDLTNKPNMVDYVTEQGTSGVWTYRKWNSGISECWGAHKYTLTAWSSWGTLYEGSSSGGAYYQESYPNNLFVARPFSVAAVQGTNKGYLLETYTEGDATKTDGYIVVRPNNTGSLVDAYINIHSIGRWK